MAIGTDAAVRLLWRRILIIVLAAGTLTVGLGAYGVYRKERESAALRQQAQARLADLKGRHEKLAADVALLQTDRGKEAALRAAYDVGAKGERLIVIVEPEAPVPQPVSTPWYQRMKWW